MKKMTVKMAIARVEMTAMRQKMMKRCTSSICSSILRNCSICFQIVSCSLYNMILFTKFPFPLTALKGRGERGISDKHGRCCCNTEGRGKESSEEREEDEDRADKSHSRTLRLPKDSHGTQHTEFFSNLFFIFNQASINSGSSL